MPGSLQQLSRVQEIHPKKSLSMTDTDPWQKTVFGKPEPWEALHHRQVRIIVRLSSPSENTIENGSKFLISYSRLPKHQKYKKYKTRISQNIRSTIVTKTSQNFAVKYLSNPATAIITAALIKSSLSSLPTPTPCESTKDIDRAIVFLKYWIRFTCHLKKPRFS